MKSSMTANTMDRIGWRSLTLVLILHGFAVFTLSNSKPVVQALGQKQALMVSLVEVAPPAPRPAESPRVRPVQASKTAQQLPIMTAAATSAALRVASVPEAMDKPEAAEAVHSSSTAQATAVTTPAAAVSPRLDADYLNNPAPAYPPLSRRMGEQGRVQLRVYVEPDGSASRVEIKTGSGFERLDNAALIAVRKWHFAPARQGDAAIGTWVVVPISFSLRS